MQMRALLIITLLFLSGCRGQWVYQEPLVERPCLGGKIDQTRRITETAVAGRVRQIVITTNACLD